MTNWMPSLSTDVGSIKGTGLIKNVYIQVQFLTRFIRNIDIKVLYSSSIITRLITNVDIQS